MLISGRLAAQEKVAHFSLWKPKDGLEKKFEAGYKEHLQWHKTNGDTWNWYGWYFLSGPRHGQFLDATFNHAWGDFDNPVKPAEDAADNAINTVPFGDFVGSFKAVRQNNLSILDTRSLESKFLRLVTIEVTHIDTAKQVIDVLKNEYRKNGITTFLTYKMVDGGQLNQFLLLIGLKSYQEFGKVAHIQDELSAVETLLGTRVIRSITSETLLYRADMTLLP